MTKSSNVKIPNKFVIRINSEEEYELLTTKYKHNQFFSGVTFPEVFYVAGNKLIMRSGGNSMPNNYTIITLENLSLKGEIVSKTQQVAVLVKSPEIWTMLLELGVKNGLRKFCVEQWPEDAYLLLKPESLMWTESKFYIDNNNISVVDLDTFISRVKEPKKSRFEILGYKVEFKDKSVHIGCKTYPIDVIKNLKKQITDNIYLRFIDWDAKKIKVEDNTVSFEEFTQLCKFLGV